MTYMASTGRVTARRLDNSLTGNIVDAALDLSAGGKVTINQAVNESLAADYVKYAGRTMANHFV